VRQSFPRGYEGRLKAAFLLRAYPAEEKEMAEAHLAALADPECGDCARIRALGRMWRYARDPNAFLYDAAVPEQLERLYIAAGQPFRLQGVLRGQKGSGLEAAGGLPGEDEGVYPPPPSRTWRTQKDGEKISIGLHEEFGELFLTFSFDKENDKIPFDLIEQY
jgi:hypothetical protein